MHIDELHTRVNAAMGVKVDHDTFLRTLDFARRFLPPDEWNPQTSDPDAPSEPLHSLPELADELKGHVLLDRGQSLELFETVCRLLDMFVEGRRRSYFRRALPAEIVASFERSSATKAPPRVGRPNTLAEGRPPSSRGLATGRIAWDDSVRDPNPHRETKLSSSSGMTQERKRRTLAEGQSGSTRPIADRES